MQQRCPWNLPVAAAVTAVVVEVAELVPAAG
jgi:hypothetical protein